MGEAASMQVVWPILRKVILVDVAYASYCYRKNGRHLEDTNAA